MELTSLHTFNSVGVLSFYSRGNLISLICHVRLKASWGDLYNINTWEIQSCVKTFLLSSGNHPQNVLLFAPKMDYGAIFQSDMPKTSKECFCTTLYISFKCNYFDLSTLDYKTWSQLPCREKMESSNKWTIKAYISYFAEFFLCGWKKLGWKVYLSPLVAGSGLMVVNVSERAQFMGSSRFQKKPSHCYSCNDRIY